MKALVTGGTGFTGSHLTRRLLDEGHEVHVVDVAPGLFDEELSRRGARIELGTVADRAFARRAVERTEPDVVFHLAAAFRQLNVPESFYWRVNVEGTRHLAEAAADVGVGKFVYCSTQGVHGHIAEPPGDEDSPIEPADYYQQTKYEAERVVRRLVNERGLDAVTVRPTAIYGPGDPARFLMLYRMCRRGTFHMFGDGQTTYHPVYIDNLVDGFLAAANASDGAGRSYLIGDARYYTLNDLVRHVGASLGVPVRIKYWPFWPLYAAATCCEAMCKPVHLTPPLFRRRVDWFRQMRAFRIDRAKRELGYQPRVGIEQGLEATAKWYRDNGYV